MHVPLPVFISTILTLLTITPSIIAHPPIFAPNHATLQKRCPPFDPAGVKNIGNGAGTQFIGGQCLSGADCASGCCANPCGICSGVGAQTQAGKTGCGFGGAGGSKATGTGTGNTVGGEADGSSQTGTGSGSVSGISNPGGEGTETPPAGKNGNSCNVGA